MYYPPSQIKTDQYTNGDEFVYYGTSEKYTGFYYIVGDGRYFTGKNPNDPPNQELVLAVNNQQQDDAEEGYIGSYSDEINTYTLPEIYIRNTSLDLGSTPPANPTHINPVPNKKDYQIGEIQRYFVKKLTSPEYVEINNSQFVKFSTQNPTVKYQLYLPFSIPWVITGNISNAFNVNKQTVNLISEDLPLPGFKSYFKERYSQYFKYTTGEVLTNLSTDGTEFKNKRTGKPYKGLYHVHPDKGPMVGAEHIDQIHDYLVLIDNNKTPYVSPPTKKEKVKMQRSIRRSGGY